MRHIYNDRHYTIGLNKVIDEYLTTTKWIWKKFTAMVLYGIFAVVMLFISISFVPTIWFESMEKYDSMKIIWYMIVPAVSSWRFFAYVFGIIHGTTTLHKINKVSKYTRTFIDPETRTPNEIYFAWKMINKKLYNSSSFVVLAIISASIAVLASMLCPVKAEVFKYLLSILGFLSMNYTVRISVLPEKRQLLTDIFEYIVRNENGEFDDREAVCCNAIVAVNEKEYIGSGNKLMYKLSKDMKLFKDITYGHTVIMGKKTFQSMNSKPLKGRINIVITHDTTLKPFIPVDNSYALYYANSVEEAIALALALGCMTSDTSDDMIWIIGGGRIYKEAMPYVGRIVQTLVYDKTVGDTKFTIPHNDFEATSMSEIIIDGDYATRRYIYNRKVL